MEMDKIRLLIADDHEIYRDGLKLLLRKTKDIEIIAEAKDGFELVQLALEAKPHVILTDIKMPRLDGIAATKQIMNMQKGVAIIALSMFDEESLIVDMMEAGAKGYLLKNADKREIIDAIKTVHAGEEYFCKTANMRLAKLVLNFKGKQEAVVERNRFTEKELELVALICQEKSNKEVGEILCCSPRTVEGYKAKVMEKMQVKSTAGIVIYSIKHGLYEMNEAKL